MSATERNWAPLGAPPHEIDAVLLSHAHIDHSGWLPRLVRLGFRGPIYASPATCDLAQVLLLDSAHRQEEDARRANRHGYSRHAQALPLYTRADAKRAIAKLVPLAPGKWRAIGDVQAMLTPVGHLLGACAITLQHGGQTLGFSGDVGRDTDILMPPPPPLALGAVDVLLVESTDGNRRHPSAVFDAVSDFRKPMDLSLWPGVNRSQAQRHGEDLQRRDGGKDAV